MKTVFDFTDYREFLNTWIDEHGEGSRGLKGRIAQACGVSSSLISLILKGHKHLTLEQAAEAADFVGLNDREAEYFFLLVEIGKAGSHKLQTKLRKRMKEQQEQAKKISKRVRKDIELSDEVKSIYYSSWIYTGIRNLSAVPGTNDVPAIAKRLNLPVAVVNRAVNFLLENGLCKKENGQLTFGPANTHVESDSPFVIKHHQNWRLRGFSFMDAFSESDLFYTCPMSLSAETAEEIRRLLPGFIEEVLKKVRPSPSEKIYCLNLDWFEY